MCQDPWQGLDCKIERERWVAREQLTERLPLNDKWVRSDTSAVMSTTQG